MSGRAGNFPAWMSSNASYNPPEADSFKRRSDDFIAWLAHQPGVRVNSKIQIADLRFKGSGRGVVAQTDILDGEELFAISRDVVLTVRNSKLGSLLSQDLEELGPWFSLILVMIYEYLLEEKSAWFPYFCVLPTQFDTLMFWSRVELMELQGSAVVDKIGKQAAEESMLEILAPIIRGNPSLFPPLTGLSSYEGPEGTAAFLKLGHVMGSLIMAYAFDIEKPEDEEQQDGEDGYMTDDDEAQQPKGMVPLADLLNADADQNNARLFQEEALFIMKAIKPIRARAEIFNDYGELPRADLLRRYGYVTDNYAPYDVVELSLSSICQAAGLETSDLGSLPQLQFLERLDLLEDGYVIPRASSVDSIAETLADELVILIKTLSLSEQELQERKRKGRPPKPSALSTPEAVILQKALQMLQARYNTSLAQDKEIIAQLSRANAPLTLDTSTRRRKLAVEVRSGEKEILQQLFYWLETLLDTSNGVSSMKRTARNDRDELRKTKTPRV